VATERRPDATWKGHRASGVLLPFVAHGNLTGLQGSRISRSQPMPTGARMRVLSVLLCAVLAACGSRGTGGSTEVSARPIDGTYEFSATILGKATAGRLVVKQDEVFLADGQSCVIAILNAKELGVSCKGGTIASSPPTETSAMLFFDRVNPASSGKWTTTIPVTRRREVCERYVKDGAAASSRCVSRKIETYTAYESRSGSVRVRRVP
jgi:hypothetical protein